MSNSWSTVFFQKCGRNFQTLPGKGICPPASHTRSPDRADSPGAGGQAVACLRLRRPRAAVLYRAGASAVFRRTEAAFAVMARKISRPGPAIHFEHRVPSNSGILQAVLPYFIIGPEKDSRRPGALRSSAVRFCAAEYAIRRNRKWI